MRDGTAEFLWRYHLRPKLMQGDRHHKENCYGNNLPCCWGETTNKAKRVEAARQARSISQSASLAGGEFVQVIIILLCGTISPSWTGCGPKPLTLEGSKFLQKSAYHSSDIVRGPHAKDEIRESDMAVYWRAARPSSSSVQVKGRGDAKTRLSQRRSTFLLIPVQDASTLLLPQLQGRAQRWLFSR